MSIRSESDRAVAGWIGGARDPTAVTLRAKWGVDTNTTRRGFTGHEHLDNISLVHMNGRVYDPVIGRVLSVDPIIGDLSDSQTINPYAYVGNRPHVWTDPSGYDGVAAGLVGVGGPFGAALSISYLIFGWGSTPPPPPAISMPGASAQTGMPPCSAGVMNSPTCGGYVLSVAGVGPSSGGPPTSSWTSQVSAEQAAMEQENLRHFFEDLAKNAVNVVILAPYHDGKASYDAAQEGRYGAAVLYTVFAVCDVGCKHVSLVLRPLAKAGGALRGAGGAARAATEMHHLLPQAKRFEQFFKRAGLDIEDFKMPLDKAKHRLNPGGVHTNSGGNWNRVWDDFFKANPSATRQEILDQLARMRRDFGI